MRVLFLAPQPFFANRGTPLRSRNVLSGLSEGGHEVDVLCYPFGSPMALPGLRIKRIPKLPGIRSVKVGPSLAKIPLDFVMMLVAAFMCLVAHYDVIEAVEESAFFGVFLRAVFGCALVYHMDSHISDHLEYSGFVKNRFLLGFARWMEKMVMRHADIVITVNEYLSEKVRTIAPEATILQLEDAPLQEVFEEDVEGATALRHSLGIGDAPVVLYTGNLGPHQGIDLLIEAAARVVERQPELRFVLVGGAPYEIRRYEDLAARLGVMDSCVFAGYRPASEMPAFMSMASILVSPRTHGTNTPLKIYDYMQSRRAVVATNLRTHTEILDDTCAFLADPEPAAFADAILDAYDHHDDAQERARHAEQRVHEKYSLSEFRAKVRTAFEELARRRGLDVLPASVSTKSEASLCSGRNRCQDRH